MGSTQVFARFLALTPLIFEVNANYLPIFSADPLGVQDVGSRLEERSDEGAVTRRAVRVERCDDRKAPAGSVAKAACPGGAAAKQRVLKGWRSFSSASPVIQTKKASLERGFVWMTGLEPATSWSLTRCATNCATSRYFKRRERDSNPRTREGQQFSRLPQ